MFKNIFGFFKRIIFSFLFIYAYNKMAAPINVFVPINLFTVGFMSLFGMPALFLFIIYSLIFV